MRNIFYTIILLSFCANISAQVPPNFNQSQNGGIMGNDSVIVIKEGVVKYSGDPRIQELLETKRHINKRNEGTKGYRIQLYSGDRKTANQFKADFINSQEDMNAYIVYEQPYFKTRVGDFRNKIDAERTLRSLSRKYSGSFVLSDAIVPESKIRQAK
jgi:hypothetical protein